MPVVIAPARGRDSSERGVPSGVTSRTACLVCECISLPGRE
ncbi:hypothetical protein HMPREF9608_00167 [Cutibacterium acnes HL067PA1]|nr:hypothetical protein HMPREF9608_00167 [Cutibacterium acnes HL067PA1]